MKHVTSAKRYETCYLCEEGESMLPLRRGIKHDTSAKREELPCYLCEEGSSMLPLRRGM
jgi:hypothetical protein